MDVRVAGSGPPSPGSDVRLLGLPDVAARLPGPAHTVRASDSIVLLVAGLATPALQSLLQRIELPWLPVNSGPWEALIHKAATAITENDVPLARQVLTELIVRSPESAARLIEEPSLRRIEGDVKELLVRITLGAKIGAEQTLTTASRLAEGGIAVALKPGHVNPVDLNPPAALALANRFLETGQYVNYVRAEELGRMVIAWYGAPLPVNRVRPIPQRILLRKLKIAWRRAPVLVLLIAWVFVGLAGGFLTWVLRESGAASPGFGFELWGIGFLALVGFQFYVTIRDIRH